MSRRRKQQGTRERIPLVKDLTLFVLGVALIVYQGFVVPPRDFNWVLVAAGGVLAGVPGWLQIWGLRNASTEPPSSLPAEVPPPLPQQSSP